jgi:hypothetical protein
MSDFSTLKEEILNWALKPGTMAKFTTNDVYEHIHSAETASHASDALRSMWKYDKTLEREEFMDGKQKRFVYWVSKSNKEVKVIEKQQPQQIEIPNDFHIELKTPSGFVITIKGSDFK